MPATCDKSISDAIAEGYFNAAQSGADMRAAADALETIRESVAREANIFDTWGSIERQIGLADLDVLAPLLARVRDAFERCVTAQAVERLNRAFEQDHAAGWESWLDSYLASFSDWGWYSSYGVSIAQNALPFSPAPDWPVERIREAARLVEKGRWPEVYDWFLFLSEQAREPRLRARMLVTAAEVQIFHYLQPGRARTLLEEAERQAKDECRVWVGWGEYLLEQGKPEDARPYFERLVARMPNNVDGFTGLGDYYAAIGDEFSAESQYQQAIQFAPGLADGYGRMIRWHGNAKWFKDREKLIAPLFERMKLVGSRASSCTQVGVVYRDNGQHARAREYFDRALREDERNVVARSWIGFTWLDEAGAEGVEEAAAADLRKRAKDCFEEVLRTAPKAMDGYNGMAQWFARNREWAAALDCWNRALHCHREWESFVLSRRANVFRELGRLEDAESDILRALALDSESPPARDALSRLAEAFEDKASTDEAIQMLGLLRELRGPSFEHTYQNRIGNVLYRAGRYADAAERYRLAVAAAPTDDVLHSNLALALENLEAPGRHAAVLEEAIAALRRAVELAPKVDEYRSRLFSDELQRDFTIVYGEAAFQLDPAMTPVRVELSEDLLPAILTPDGTNLSEELIAAIEQMRHDLSSRLGVRVPGLRFAPLIPEDAAYGDCRIRIVARADQFGRIGPGGISPESLAKRVVNDAGALLEANLDAFVDHDDVLLMLDTCAAEWRSFLTMESGELTRFVGVLRALCRKRVPLVPLDRVVSEYIDLRKAGRALGEVLANLIEALSPKAVGAGAPAR